MKKLSILALSIAATTALAACGQMSQSGLCDDQQTIGCAPYTNERTAMAKPKAVVETPAPAPVAEPAPEPAPAPAEEKIMMQSAEPQFKQISK
ncbi:MAG: hypothetical protein HRT94_02995 [Alphaproteobacteria bacterium]|nr:hypothetical protein [Alphaproteobacteria bacterium]